MAANSTNNKFQHQHGPQNPIWKKETVSQKNTKSKTRFGTYDSRNHSSAQYNRQRSYVNTCIHRIRRHHSLSHWWCQMQSWPDCRLSSPAGCSACTATRGCAGLPGTPFAPALCSEIRLSPAPSGVNSSTAGNCAYLAAPLRFREGSVSCSTCARKHKRRTSNVCGTFCVADERNLLHCTSEQAQYEAGTEQSSCNTLPPDQHRPPELALTWER